MRRNKKKEKITFLLLLLLGISIGFAALATTLKINGNASITKNTWNIYWDNIGNEQGVTPAEGDETDIIDESSTIKKNIVTWTVTFDKPGDFYEFQVDAVNAGTIDAEILSIEKKYDGNVISQENPLPAYLKYDVTYVDNNNAPAVGDKLLKRDDSTTPYTPTRRRYKVRVEYDRNAVTNSDVNTQTGNVSHTFNLAVNYGQATPSEGGDDPDLTNRIAEIEAAPEQFRNPQQDVANEDIAIDKNGNVLNLNRWIGYRCDNSASYDDPYEYYGPSDYDKAYYDNGDGTATIGGNGIIAMATASDTIVNGEWIEPIPAYIMFAGTSEFIPVTTTASLFARGYYDSSERTTITKYPNFPKTITKIGGSTFQAVGTFENVTIPKHIESVDWCAFSGAFDISAANNTLSFENGSQLKYIGVGAFEVNNLVGDLVIPSNVTMVENEAFVGNNLNSVSLPTAAEYYDNYENEYHTIMNSFDQGITLIRY